jgi:hypothetical protein
MAENSGDLIAVGEIQNTGSSTLGSVSVAGLAYNSSQMLIDSNQAYIPINELLPQQKAPFYIDFLPENSVVNVSSDSAWIPSLTNVTVVVSYAAAATTTQYTDLTPTSSGSDSSGTYTITGTVKNTGSQTAGGLWVDATFYNASGTVVAMNYTDYLDPSGLLAQGASVPFIATPADNTPQLSSEIKSYSVIVESQAPTGTLGSPTPTPPPSTSPTPVVTSPPASNTSVLTIAAIGVVVVVVVVLVGFLLLRKRRQPPPPPPPPT